MKQYLVCLYSVFPFTAAVHASASRAEGLDFLGTVTIVLFGLAGAAVLIGVAAVISAFFVLRRKQGEVKPWMFVLNLLGLIISIFGLLTFSANAGELDVKFFFRFLFLLFLPGFLLFATITASKKMKAKPPVS